MCAVCIELSHGLTDATLAARRDVNVVACAQKLADQRLADAAGAAGDHNVQRHLGFDPDPCSERSMHESKGGAKKEAHRTADPRGVMDGICRGKP